MRRKALLGFIISALFLYVAMRKVDFGDLWEVLKSAQWHWLAIYVASAVVLMKLRAWRWMLILRPVGNVPFPRVYAATMIGFMANNILPARLGEIARAVSLGIKAGISRSAVLATIIVERIYDSFTLLMFLWLVFAFSRLLSHSEYSDLRHFGWIFLFINVGLVLLLIVIQLRNDLVVRWITRMSRRFSDRIQRLATEITEKFARGLTIHHNVPTTIRVVLSSVVLWFLLGLSNYAVFLALGFSDLPIEASFVVLVVVSLSISIPSSPGFIGVYHLAASIALQIYGLNETEAIAIAIVMHAGQYIPITLLGFYHLRREHLRLRTSGEAEGTDIATGEAQIDSSGTESTSSLNQR